MEISDDKGRSYPLNYFNCQRYRGGHPGGTCAIGTVVDNNLKTSVNNFYICDNSIMPISGGVPPVLTLIALGKKFARTML